MTEETILLRQINPSWVQQGRVTSQAFRPTPKDDAKLSVYDGDQITAAESWKHFVGRGLAAKGTMGVTVAECTEESLTARPDPEPFPEHAVIDFADLSNKQVEKKSKKLSARSRTRGWLYEAD
ncbi:MAG: hypothetical protein ACOC0P_07605 [Planctomycetota bacterium]